MNKKEEITLTKLINILTKIRKKMKNGKYEVEFYLDDEPIELESIGHFHVYPTTNFNFKSHDEGTVPKSKK